MKYLITLTGLSLILCSNSFAENGDTQNCHNLVGTWKNTSGRILTVKSVDEKSGEIRGYYQLPPAIDPYKYTLNGWFNSLPDDAKNASETAVSFSVQWGEFSSISSWIGTCSEENDRSQLSLIWHQARLNSAQKNERISTGFDTFYPE